MMSFLSPLLSHQARQTLSTALDLRSWFAWLPRQCVLCRRSLDTPHTLVPHAGHPSQLSSHRQDLAHALLAQRLICGDCHALLPDINRTPTCDHCHTAHALSASPDHPGRLLCAHCHEGDLSALDSISVAWGYESPVVRAILRFKHWPDATLVTFFTQGLMMAWREQNDDLSADMILAVPMHPRRLAERGFNGPALLAKAWHRHWPKKNHERQPMLSHQALIKIRDTGSQEGRHRQARFSAVRQAFRADEQVLHRHIVLVDDVMTTGATLQAAASALKKSGARKVSAVVVARAPYHENLTQTFH